MLLFSTTVFANDDTVSPIRFNTTIVRENVSIYGLNNILNEKQLNKILNKPNIDVYDGLNISFFNSLDSCTVKISIIYNGIWYGEDCVKIKVYKHNKLIFKRKFYECFCYKFPDSWLKDKYLYIYEIGKPQTSFMWLVKDKDYNIELHIFEDAKYN